MTYSAGTAVHNILNSPSVLKNIKDFTPKLLMTSSFFSHYASQTERRHRALVDVGISFLLQTLRET